MKQKTLKRINTASLHLFNAVLSVPNAVASEGDLRTANQLFTDYFAVINPEARYAVDTIEPFIKQVCMTAKQLNATFYRSFEDILIRTPLELLIDQILQYFTIQWKGPTGAAYVPADFSDLNLEAPEEKWKVFYVDVLSQEDLTSKCISLLKSGTALDLKTIEDIVAIIDGLKIKIDANEVRNKEAKAVLIARDLKAAYGQNYDPVEVLRATVYDATKQLMLIKNLEFITAIGNSQYNVSDMFQNYGTETLASIFKRFKYVFIAFKKAHQNNRKVINKISKQSQKFHKPLVANPLNSVSHRALNLKTDQHWLDNASRSALLRALNVCNSYMHDREGFKYLVRNGKVWVKDKKKTGAEAAEKNFAILYKQLINLLKPKFANKKVFIPKGIEYGLPISEKQMLGNIPFGTRITVPSSESIALGLHWTLKDGGQIMDLSGTLKSGRHIAWNSIFKADTFVHSGDQCAVREDDGATEYILAQKNPPKDVDEELLVRVNCWSGSKVHSFQVIVGKGSDVDKQYMMDPANLIVCGRFEASVRMSVIGVIKQTAENTTVILTPGGMGNYRQSSSVPEHISRLTRAGIQNDILYYITLNQLLEKVGAIIVDDAKEEVEFNLATDKINKDFFNLILGE